MCEIGSIWNNNMNLIISDDGKERRLEMHWLQSAFALFHYMVRHLRFPLGKLLMKTPWENFGLLWQTACKNNRCMVVTLLNKTLFLSCLLLDAYMEGISAHPQPWGMWTKQIKKEIYTVTNCKMDFILLNDGRSTKATCGVHWECTQVPKLIWCLLIQFWKRLLNKIKEVNNQFTKYYHFTYFVFIGK